jgi:hypothetical protein
MKVVKHPIAVANASEVGELHHRENTYRRMVLLACSRAIILAGYHIPLDVTLDPGIAFFTLTGEKYPEAWAALPLGSKPKPTQFESIIHNSAPGYAAIQLGLTGPQIVLVNGNIEKVATLQLISGRSRFMLVCRSEAEGPASCYVLEAVD